MGSKSGTGSFKGIKGFPSGFDFVIASQVNKELAFLSLDSTLNKLSTSHSSGQEDLMETSSLAEGTGSSGNALRSALR